MFDLPNLTIQVESPNSAQDVSDLVALCCEDTGTEEELYAPNTEFIVARLDGRPVGCIALMDRVRFAEARRLFVIEEVRGNGIGAALVAAMEAAARDLGLRQVRLNSTLSTQHARRTFQRSGFQVAMTSSADWLEKSL
ncbi:MAG: GNAT family N-acetyltransferase [Pseudomonadota bacterium]